MGSLYICLEVRHCPLSDLITSMSHSVPKSCTLSSYIIFITSFTQGINEFILLLYFMKYSLQLKYVCLKYTVKVLH